MKGKTRKAKSAQKAAIQVSRARIMYEPLSDPAREPKQGTITATLLEIVRKLKRATSSDVQEYAVKHNSLKKAAKFNYSGWLRYLHELKLVSARKAPKPKAAVTA